MTIESPIQKDKFGKRILQLTDLLGTRVRNKFDYRVFRGYAVIISGNRAILDIDNKAVSTDAIHAERVYIKKFPSDRVVGAVYKTKIWFQGSEGQYLTRDSFPNRFESICYFDGDMLRYPIELASIDMPISEPMHIRNVQYNPLNPNSISNLLPHLNVQTPELVTIIYAITPPTIGDEDKDNE